MAIGNLIIPLPGMDFPDSQTGERDVTSEYIEKDVTREYLPKPGMLETAWDYAGEFGRQLESSLIMAVKGKGGVNVVDQDAYDAYVAGAKKASEEFIEKYASDEKVLGTPLTHKDFAESVSSFPFSFISMGSGITAGAGTLAVTKSPKAAYAAGGAASGAAAYRISSAQVMQSYLSMINDIAVETDGTPLTKEEQELYRSKFDGEATKYGLWEAIPEAIGNVSAVGIFFKKLTGALGKNLATRMMAKLGGMYGTEIATEAVTQHGQHNIQVEAGMEPGEKRSALSLSDWGENIKEVFPQTFILVTFMGAGGGAGVQISARKKAQTIVNAVEEGGHEQVPAPVLEQIVKEAQGTMESRPWDKKLAAAVDTLNGELERRKGAAAEGPQAGAAAQPDQQPAEPEADVGEFAPPEDQAQGPIPTIGRSFTKLSPEYFADLQGALSKSQDKAGDAFGIADAEAMLESYKATPGADPASIIAFDSLLKPYRMRDQQRKSDAVEFNKFQTALDTGQFASDEAMLAERERIRQAYPHMADKLNRAVVAYKAAQLNAPAAKEYSVNFVGDEYHWTNPEGKAGIVKILPLTEAEKKLYADPKEKAYSEALRLAKGEYQGEERQPTTITAAGTAGGRGPVAGGIPSQAKEPWQKTREEYRKWMAESATRDGKPASPEDISGRIPTFDAFHERIVARALSEGRPVPAEVLADYPDLTQGKPATPAAPQAPAAEAPEAPGVVADKALMEKIEKSYSAQSIAEKGSHVKNPFKHEGKDRISVGGTSGMEIKTYELVPASEYKGETYGYNDKKKFGYEGMKVKFKGKDYILSNELMFERAMPTNEEAIADLEDKYKAGGYWASKHKTFDDAVVGQLEHAETTVDATRWDKIFQKGKVLNAVLGGDINLDIIEDISEETMSAKMMAAEASGDPLMATYATLLQEVQGLRFEQSAHLDQTRRARMDAAAIPGRISAMEKRLEDYAKSIDTMGKVTAVRFVGDERTLVFEKHGKEIAEALEKTVAANAVPLEARSPEEQQSKKVPLLVFGTHTETEVKETVKDAEGVEKEKKVKKYSFVPMPVKADIIPELLQPGKRRLLMSGDIVSSERDLAEISKGGKVDIKANVSRTVTEYVSRLERVSEEIRGDIERLKADEPKLKKVAETSWPKADTYAKKGNELREIEIKMAAGGVAAGNPELGLPVKDYKAPVPVLDNIEADRDSWQTQDGIVFPRPIWKRGNLLPTKFAVRGNQQGLKTFFRAGKFKAKEVFNSGVPDLMRATYKGDAVEPVAYTTIHDESNFWVPLDVGFATIKPAEYLLAQRITGKEGTWHHIRTGGASYLVHVNAGGVADALISAEKVGTGEAPQGVRDLAAAAKASADTEAQPTTPADKLTDETGAIYLYPDSEIYRALVAAKNNIQEAMPHLEALGVHVYHSGKTKLSKWWQGMKHALGDLWASFKGVMGKVWGRVKEISKQVGERGSIPVIKGKDIEQKADEITGDKDKYTKEKHKEPAVTKDTPADKLNEWVKDEADAFIQTAIANLPSNVHHMSFVEKALKSPEWYAHPVLSRIVRLFVRDRNELYHEYFNHLASLHDSNMVQDTVMELAKELKHKGLTRVQIIKGESSKEYKQLQWIIDYGDTTYVRNLKKSLPNQLKDFEAEIRKQGVSEEAIKVWKYYRQSYDAALDLLTAQMQQMINAIEEEAAFRGIKPADYSDLFTTLKGALATMRQWRGFYAPRLRQGNWSVTAERPTGPEEKEYYREHRWSEWAARRLARKLERQGWKIKSVAEIEKLPESVYQDLKTVDLAKSVERAIERMSKGDTGESMMASAVKFNEELLQDLADMIRSRGFRSSMIHRKPGDDVIRGYVEDPMERHIIYVNNLARGMAKARVAQAAYEEMLGTYIKGRKTEDGGYVRGRRFGGIDPAREPQVYEAAKDYIEEQLRNVDKIDRTIAWAKSLATLKFLGFSVRAALVNQTAMVTTAPAAIHQYAMDGKGSMNKVLREIGRAGKDYASVMVTKKLPEGDEGKFLADQHRLGWDDPQYTRDAMSNTMKLHNRTWSATMDVSMWLFGKTEQWNRGSTMLAAYRLARKQGKPHEEASEIAKNCSDKSHGIYGRATLPSVAWGRNPAAKIAQMLYVYGKFSHNYLQLLYDLGAKKHNIKGALYALLAPVVIGGMAAWPFRDHTIYPLIGLILTALGAKDHDEDTEKWVWDWTREHLGKGAEVAGRYGVFGAMGLDISGSLSIGVGIPKDLWEWGGAIGGMAKEATQAWDKAMIGDYERAAEHLLPTGLAGSVRAYREHRRGIVTGIGKRMYDEGGKPYMPSTGETILRVAGARSSHQATMQARLWEAKRQAGDFQDRRNRIYERYRTYLQEPDRDHEEYKAIQRERRAFNDKIKELGLKGEVALITREGLKRQEKEMRQASKKIRRMLQ